MRGEPIVRRVLAAAIDELARAGYKALRMEDVALSAGVNKTTVYRRWPEKSALVRDALWTLAGDQVVAPATGSLRGDLLALGRAMTELCASPRGQCVIRMLVAEGSDPEVAELKKEMRARHEAVPREVIAGAVRRGELSRDGHHVVLFEAFMGALHHQIFFMNTPVTDAFMKRLVDLLLNGALDRPAAPEAPRRVRMRRPGPPG